MEFEQVTPLIFEATNSQWPVTIANVYGVGWVVKTPCEQPEGFKSFEEAKRVAECLVPFTVNLGE
jgi:hypothetical protein